MFKIHNSRGEKKVLKGIILSMFAGAFAFVFVPYILLQAASAEEIDIKVVVDDLSLRLDTGYGEDNGNVDFRTVNTDEYGTLVMVKKDIRVDTTAKNYMVYLSSTSNQVELKNTNPSSTGVINTVSGSFEVPVNFKGAGKDNTWGFAVTEDGEVSGTVGGFASASTYFMKENSTPSRYGSWSGKPGESDASDSHWDTTWAALGAYSQPTMIYSDTIEDAGYLAGFSSGLNDEGVRDANTSWIVPCENGSTPATSLCNSMGPGKFSVYYGAKIVNSSIQSGEYKNTVVYTAIASLKDISNDKSDFAFMSSNLGNTGIDAGDNNRVVRDTVKLTLNMSSIPELKESDVKVYFVDHNSYGTDFGFGEGVTISDSDLAARGAECSVTDVEIQKSDSSAQVVCQIPNVDTATLGTTGKVIRMADYGMDWRATNDRNSYDVIVSIPNYHLKFTTRINETTPGFAYVGLQTRKSTDVNDYYVTKMQQMTSGICVNTNEFKTGGWREGQDTYDTFSATNIAGMGVYGKDLTAAGMSKNTYQDVYGDYYLKESGKAYGGTIGVDTDDDGVYDSGQLSAKLTDLLVGSHYASIFGQSAGVFKPDDAFFGTYNPYDGKYYKTVASNYNINSYKVTLNDTNRGTSVGDLSVIDALHDDEYEALIAMDPTATTPYEIWNKMTAGERWEYNLYRKHQWELQDTRDNKYYIVRRLADGNCWMTQNLDLDLTTNMVLTDADSDINAYRNEYGQTVSKNDLSITNFTNGGDALVDNPNDPNNAAMVAEAKAQGFTKSWTPGMVVKTINPATNKPYKAEEINSDTVCNGQNTTETTDDDTGCMWIKKYKFTNTSDINDRGTYMITQQEDTHNTPMLGFQTAPTNEYGGDFTWNQTGADGAHVFDQGYRWYENSRPSTTVQGVTTKAPDEYAPHTMCLDDTTIVDCSDPMLDGAKSRTYSLIYPAITQTLKNDGTKGPDSAGVVHGDTSLAGNWYNWYAATAGSGTSQLSSGDASDSICPKGWGMAGNDGDRGYRTLIWSIYGETKFGNYTSKYLENNREIYLKDMAHLFPFSINSSNVYMFDGTILKNEARVVHLWTTKLNNQLGSLDLAIDRVNFVIGGYPKGYGFSVRCEAKSVS